MRKRLAVEAQQDVVEPQAGPVGGSAGYHGEHARPGLETERPNRRRPEIRAILRKVVHREAGKVGPIAAQVPAGDGEAMADRRDALVERAGREQRGLRPLLGAGGARHRQQTENQSAKNDASHQDLPRLPNAQSPPVTKS